MMRTVLCLSLMLLTLAACGVRGEPLRPADADPAYPRTYPGTGTPAP
ncbi:MAG: hypothetical protein INF44_05550 [Thalassospira sp.]|nr:hypothetical protein [Thalassospira sp.]